MVKRTRPALEEGELSSTDDENAPVRHPPKRTLSQPEPVEIDSPDEEGYDEALERQLVEVELQAQMQRTGEPSALMIAEDEVPATVTDPAPPVGPEEVIDVDMDVDRAMATTDEGEGDPFADMSLPDLLEEVEGRQLEHLDKRETSLYVRGYRGKVKWDRRDRTKSLKLVDDRNLYVSGTHRTCLHCLSPLFSLAKGKRTVERLKCPCVRSQYPGPAETHVPLVLARRHQQAFFPVGGEQMDLTRILTRVQARVGLSLIEDLMAHAQLKAIGVTTWVGKATRALREATEKRASNQQARDQTRVSVAQDRAVAVTAAVASPKMPLEVQEFQMPSGLEPAVLKPEDEELLRGFLQRMKDRSEPGTLEEYKDKRINLTIIPMLVDVYEGTGRGREAHTDTLIPGLGALSRQVEGLTREIPRTDKGVPCHEQYQHQRRVRSQIACCAEIQVLDRSAVPGLEQGASATRVRSCFHAGED